MDRWHAASTATLASAFSTCPHLALTLLSPVFPQRSLVESATTPKAASNGAAGGTLRKGGAGNRARRRFSYVLTPDQVANARSTGVAGSADAIEVKASHMITQPAPGDLYTGPLGRHFSPNGPTRVSSLSTHQHYYSNPPRRSTTGTRQCTSSCFHTTPTITATRLAAR